MRINFNVIIKQFIFLALLLISFKAVSQIRYGVTTGVNISRFNNEFEAINGNFFNMSSVGLKLGVFSEIPINENILFSPKLIYSQMGDREKDYGEVPARGLDITTVDYKLDYITIPLNIRFFNKLYVEIGPQIGILINQTPESLDLGDLESSIDLGANIEVGYKINDFSLALNVYHGFTNVLEIEQDQPLISNDLDVRNFTISLNLGYLIL